MSADDDKFYIKNQLSLFAAANSEPKLGDAELEAILDKAQTMQDWVAETAYALDCVNVRPITINGYQYKLIVAGTSGADEPTWTTLPCSTVEDGTAVWINAGKAPKYAYDLELSVFYAWQIKAAKASELIQLPEAAQQQVYKQCLAQVIATAPTGHFTDEQLRALQGGAR